MFRSAVFDFDYTLADSSLGVTECINFALGELGLAPVDYETACRMIGLSLKETYRRIIGERPASEADEFSRLFIRRADETMVEMTVLYETVGPTTQALMSGGMVLGIVSTKYRRRIEAVLAREGLSDRFEVIIGGEDVREHKPDPEGLIKALDALGSSCEDTLYVGDSVTDAIVAERTGVPFVAVLTGVTPKDAFAPYQAIDILESVDQLPAFIAGRV
ncbi:MAG TPA: HAD-IA family hydrolase [Blastocatellia bacterium]|nr:HAD-IA family hydrolase [Blastocatellia bacterium]